MKTEPQEQPYPPERSPDEREWDQAVKEFGVMVDNGSLALGATLRPLNPKPENQWYWREAADRGND